ncbi:glutathione peroxidase [Salipaludibacillus neizhouensis]|uniref:Glutathione peroxidase n=1 Tax=Salipaludibacillus neizhouensis TaxID=885475 RepID=A0A3A9K5M4_9BACI|nr:glutathione peroxidase [Salipaludibacillus neizhouensis]RKL67877.1 glutathione peroxidase [Salipaludibacillus neizhouensis]
MTKIHDLSVQKPNGDEISLEPYKGNVLVIVNTATKCGLAPQFKELEALHQKYKDQGVSVLGFPSNQFMNQEPVEDDKMEEACEINFGVTFPLFKKINVNGKDAHPLYKHLKAEQKGMLSSEIKWNFTKFLVDQQGNVVKRYSPQTSPIKIETEIDELLGL